MDAMKNDCPADGVPYDAPMCAREPARHAPVLHMDGDAAGEPSVLAILQPKTGETVLDATLGLGGHASAFLRAVGPKGALIGLDADLENLEAAGERLMTQPGRLTLIHGNFRDAAELVQPPVDILFADLGVSSPHFDDPTRGFTFRADSPLDLRFDRSSGKTAAQRLASVEADELGHIFARYGEFRGSHKLASRIVEQQQVSPIATTTDLRSLVDEVFGYKAPQILPQVFQALRIWVNDELCALERLLAAIPQLLAPGGRAGIISYHSLEDRLVKHAFRSLCETERDTITGQELRPAPFLLLTRKPVTPSPSEIARNPRARSAHFRAIQRQS